MQLHQTSVPSGGCSRRRELRARVRVSRSDRTRSRKMERGGGIFAIPMPSSTSSLSFSLLLLRPPPPHPPCTFIRSRSAAFAPPTRVRLSRDCAVLAAECPMKDGNSRAPTVTRKIAADRLSASGRVLHSEVCRSRSFVAGTSQPAPGTR